MGQSGPHCASAALTGGVSVPDRQDQRVLTHSAEAGGQQLSGGMVIDVKGAGLGGEGDIKGRWKRKSGVLLDRNCVAGGTLQDPEAIFLF